MPIKQASNPIIIKVSKPVSRTFNQLELIVDALYDTTRRSVVKVSDNFIKPTDNIVSLNELYKGIIIF